MAKDINDLPAPGSRIEEFLEYLAYNGGTGGSGNSATTITGFEYDNSTNNLTITLSDNSNKVVNLGALKTEWNKLNFATETPYFFNLASEGEFRPGILREDRAQTNEDFKNRDWVNVRFKVKAGRAYRITTSANQGEFSLNPLVCHFFDSNGTYVSQTNWTKNAGTIFNNQKYSELQVQQDLASNIVYGSCCLRVASNFNERESLMIWDTAESVEPTEYVEARKGGVSLEDKVQEVFKSKTGLKSAIVDEALDELNVKTKSNTSMGVKVFDIEDNIWNSIYFRIPALVKAKDDSWIAFSDIRYNTGSDHAFIDNGFAKSSDDGKTWTYGISAMNDRVNKKLSRVMDSTAVVTHTGRIINIVGGWNTDEKWTLNTSAIPKADWRVIQAISDDNGETWRQVNIHTGNKVTLPNSVVQGYGGIRGWLGGVGTGIVMKHSSHRNRIIMPIQVSFGNNEVRSGCIYSDNNGDSWTMCSQFADNNTSENMILELNDGSLIMTARRDSRALSRGAYISNDGGVTWNVYSDLHGKFTFGGADGSSGCQGSWIKYDAVNGDEIGLLSHPKNTTNTWKRDNITIYMYNFTRPTMGIVELLVPYPKEGDAEGAGYSSMYYAKNQDGKKILGMLYEDLGSITFKDLTYLLDEIDKICLKNGGDVTLEGRNQFTGSIEFNRANNPITGRNIEGIRGGTVLDDAYWMGYRGHTIQKDSYIGIIKVAVKSNLSVGFTINNISVCAVEDKGSRDTDIPYETVVNRQSYTVKEGTGVFERYIEIPINSIKKRTGYLMFKQNLTSTDRYLRTTTLGETNFIDENVVHVSDTVVTIDSNNGRINVSNPTRRFVMLYEVYGMNIDVEKTLLKLVNSDTGSGLLTDEQVQEIKNLFTW